MRTIVIGATGTVGRAVTAALSCRLTGIVDGSDEDFNVGLDTKLLVQVRRAARLCWVSETPTALGMTDHVGTPADAGGAARVVRSTTRRCAGRWIFPRWPGPRRGWPSA